LKKSRYFSELIKSYNDEVDDLVTDESKRSSGVGQALMDHLQRVAKGAGCESYNLDSGVQRQRAHKFYFREGMAVTGFHFGKRLK